jgi:hypothetical protein
MSSAIRGDAAPGARSIIGHAIGGRIHTNDVRRAAVFNPATGEAVAQVALASRAEVDEAVEAAKGSFPSWSETSPLRRARVLFKFKELLERDRDDVAALITREHGKVFSDAQGEVQRGIEVVEFACGIPQLLKGQFSDNIGGGIDNWSIRAAERCPTSPARPSDTSMAASSHSRSTSHLASSTLAVGRAKAARSAAGGSSPASHMLVAAALAPNVPVTHTSSFGSAPSRRTGQAVHPSTTTSITSGPGERDRSPPMTEAPTNAAASRTPACTAPTSTPRRGAAVETMRATGVAAMAARSESAATAAR